MMKTLRFCIAGFILSVQLPEGWDAGALLPSFRPFACNPRKGTPQLFACTVGTNSETCREEETGSLLEETVNDLGSVRLFFRAGQYEVRLRTRPDGQDHVMRADNSFTQIRIGISPRDEDAGHVLSSLLRIAYSQAILYHDALAFHASAVSRNGEAFLFMGRSVRGKAPTRLSGYAICPAPNCSTTTIRPSASRAIRPTPTEPHGVGRPLATNRRVSPSAAWCG